MASCGAEFSEEDDLNLFEQDLNDTWDYEDLSMETKSNANTNKRVRSESENSDSSEIKIAKKHSPIHDYSRIGINAQSSLQIVIAESPEVNLGKINPISVAKTINDLVGKVEKVQSLKNGLKIVCQKSQANLLRKENKFGRYRCSFTLKNNKEFLPKIKGITHGIPLSIEISELEKELKDKNVSVSFGKISRLQKFYKTKGGKTDTESIIIEFNSESKIEFPLHLFMGYKRITVKEFIPHPIRCFNCQKYGHISQNCRSKQKCPVCSEEHSFEQCQNKDKKKCSNCGGNHSAGYKGCQVFKEAKEIKELSYQKKITYAEATKQMKFPNPQNQTTVTENNNHNEEVIVNKVFEKVQIQSNQNQEHIVDKIAQKVQTENKQCEEKIVDKIIDKVQTQYKENEEEIIDKISNRIMLQTNEIMDDIISKTEQRCRCKIPPEGFLVFIIRAIKYFKEEQFLTKSSEKQSSLLIHIFEKCTNTSINQIKFKNILHS